MPDYLVLLATLGGLTVFGLAGFVAGPVIAALFLVMWEMFTEEYAPLDSSEPPGGPARAETSRAPGGGATGSNALARDSLSALVTSSSTPRQPRTHEAP